MNENIESYQNDRKNNYSISTIDSIIDKKIIQNIVKIIKDELIKNWDKNLKEKMRILIDAQTPPYRQKEFYEILYHLINEEIKWFEEILSNGKIAEIGLEWVNHTILELINEVLIENYVKKWRKYIKNTQKTKHLIISTIA